MENDNRLFTLVIFAAFIPIVLFLFGISYYKAQIAYDKATSIQASVEKVSNQMDDISNYFKITPKQQIINTIKINMETENKPVGVENVVKNEVVVDNITAPTSTTNYVTQEVVNEHNNAQVTTTNKTLSEDEMRALEKDIRNKLGVLTQA